MPWEAVVLLSLYGLNAVLSVAIIGRPRPVYTPAFAAWNLLVTGFLALLVWRLA